MVSCQLSFQSHGNPTNKMIPVNLVQWNIQILDFGETEHCCWISTLNPQVLERSEAYFQISKVILYTIYTIYIYIVATHTPHSAGQQSLTPEWCFYAGNATISDVSCVCCTCLPTSEAFPVSYLISERLVQTQSRQPLWRALISKHTLRPLPSLSWCI